MGATLKTDSMGAILETDLSSSLLLALPVSYLVHREVTISRAALKIKGILSSCCQVFYFLIFALFGEWNLKGPVGSVLSYLP